MHFDASVVKDLDCDSHSSAFITNADGVRARNRTGSMRRARMQVAFIDGRKGSGEQDL